MNKGKKGKSRQNTGKKTPYRSPQLTVHGDVGKLTRTKKGHYSDGFRKPSTRAYGSNA